LVAAVRGCADEVVALSEVLDEAGVGGLPGQELLGEDAGDGHVGSVARGIAALLGSQSADVARDRVSEGWRPLGDAYWVAITATMVATARSLSMVTVLVVLCVSAMALP
jgi:hypothetical protein